MDKTYLDNIINENIKKYEEIFDKLTEAADLIIKQDEKSTSKIQELKLDKQYDKLVEISKEIQQIIADIKRIPELIESNNMEKLYSLSPAAVNIVKGIKGYQIEDEKTEKLEGKSEKLDDSIFKELGEVLPNNRILSSINKHREARQQRIKNKIEALRKKSGNILSKQISLTDKDVLEKIKAIEKINASIKISNIISNRQERNELEINSLQEQININKEEIEIVKEHDDEVYGLTSKNRQLQRKLAILKLKNGLLKGSNSLRTIPEHFSVTRENINNKVENIEEKISDRVDSIKDNLSNRLDLAKQKSRDRISYMKKKHGIILDAVKWAKNELKDTKQAYKDGILFEETEHLAM